MSKNSPIQMRKRVFVATMLVIAVGIGLICKLAQLQLVQGEELQQKATNQQMRDTSVNATRGSIYDTNMEVLAQSATVWNIFISPADIKATTDEQKETKRRTIANGLAEILGLDAEEVYQKTLKTQSYQVYIKKKVENDVREQILKFKSEHPTVSAVIGLEEDTRRYYPNGDLAATVLGFTGTDGQGLAGLEAYYDTDLTGTPGRVMTIKNALGTEMDFEYEQRVDAEDGNSLVLTVDKVIQGYLEKNLDKALEDYEAERAVGIVLNVNTFEILGMSTRSAYDPNDPFTIADEEKAAAIAALTGTERSAALSAAQNLQWRNTAISDTYEPGSVFKSVTATSALDEGAITLNTTVNCPGFLTIGGWVYHCNNHAVHGTQSIVEALENSCNLGFIQVGQKLGAAAFCQYYRAFGLTEKTGIDLPGEVTLTTVHYHTEATMGITELASSSFGQSQKVTALQMVTAMATIVNGGHLGTPHLVRQILDFNGNIASTIGAGIKRQVVSESTSEQMRYALEKVVSEGGGKNAAVEGYLIGGKTGTAEKLDSENSSARVVSFCGFAPADDPQVACIIVVDEPRAGSYGSTVAAPIFKAVMEDVLPYLGVEKTGDTTENTKSVSVPKVIGNAVSDASETLKSSGLVVQVLGDGDTVLSQYPNPQTSVSEGGVVVLFTNEESKNTLTEVPDFTNMSLIQANQTAAAAGINIRISGNATSSGAMVAQQSIEAKSQVTPGTLITLEFIIQNSD